MSLRLYVEEDEAPESVENTSTGQGETLSEDHLLGQYIPLHYHFNMLQDRHRVDAFVEAIETVVQPGMHVLELGGGTGLLSWLAAQQGAKVTCVERNPALVGRSRELLAKNRLGDQVTVVPMDARDYVPTEPIDIVICEMLHAGLLREKQLEVIRVFKDHYLDVFGSDSQLPKFFPEATTMLLQPVQFSYNFAGYHAPLPLFQDPTAAHDRTTELGEMTTYASVFYDEVCPTSFSGVLDLEVTHPGTFTALRFATQNLITILMDQQRGIPWANQLLVLPMKTPVVVAVGEKIRVKFNYLAGGTLESLAESLSVEVRFANDMVRKVA